MKKDGREERRESRKVKREERGEGEGQGKKWERSNEYELAAKLLVEEGEF